MTKSILITGCSSGIGYACAMGLKKRGWRVFATVRNTADRKRLEAEGLEALIIDTRDSASLKACAAEVAKRTSGKLDALFNNGGYGQPGAVEDISRQVLEQQFSTLVFGWHELTTLCLPLLRANGSGRIINCSSVLGITAMKWRGDIILRNSPSKASPIRCALSCVALAYLFQPLSPAPSPHALWNMPSTLLMPM